MVPAKFPADGLVALVGQIPDQIHGDLPGHDHVVGFQPAPEQIFLHPVEPGDLRDDQRRRGQIVAALHVHILDGPGHVGQIQGHAVEIVVGFDDVDRALQGPDVVGDVLGNVVADFVRQIHAQGVGLVLDDGHPGLVVRRDDVADQTSLKAGPEPVRQQGNLRGRTVRGQNDLLPALKELVEGVEELLLRGGLAADELDVVHQKQVRVPVFFAEFHVFPFPEGNDQLVGELLGADVDDVEVRIILLDPVGNGIEQMGLAQARGAVDEQGVVGGGGLVGDRQSRVVGKPVGGTHHKAVKGELGIEFLLVAEVLIFLILRQLLLADHLNLLILTCQIPDRVPDVAQAAVVDEVLAEFRRGIDRQLLLGPVQNVGLVKKSGNDPGRQALVQIGDHLGPDVGVGIHE